MYTVVLYFMASRLGKGSDARN
uniref:Uncharacterized protein n=1 Tax=Rhizophora mucronata TaxID=61149 RepID=A0A2P2NVF7_RHIMU